MFISWDRKLDCRFDTEIAWNSLDGQYGQESTQGEQKGSLIKYLNGWKDEVQTLVIIKGWDLLLEMYNGR